MRIEQKLSIPIFLLGISNLITCIMNSDAFIYYVLYVGVILSIGILVLFIKNAIIDKTISTILLVIGLGFAFLGSVPDLTVISLVVFSISIDKKINIKHIIFSFIYIALFLISFNQKQLTSSQVSGYISGSIFMLIIYQHYIHPKVKDNNHPQELLKLYDSRKVKDQVVDIVHLKVQGYDWPEINDKLFLNVADDRVRRIVTDERKRLGFKNQDEFIFWMTTSGIIKPQSVDFGIKN